MRGRNESLVFFELEIEADGLLDFISHKEEIGMRIGMTQCIVAAIARVLTTHTTLNRFVSGGRLYQRKKTIISFSMKRKKGDKDSKIALVRQEVTNNDDVEHICKEVAEKISREHSEEKTYADKEYALLTAVPRFVLRFGVWFVQKLDDFNILPYSFIKNDALYCSAFVANVGSLGMPPGYHHLYEWGNCPIFITVGQCEERITLKSGQVGKKLMLPLKLTFDERINDAMGVKQALSTFKKILEEPAQYLQKS